MGENYEIEEYPDYEYAGYYAWDGNNKKMKQTDVLFVGMMCFMEKRKMDFNTLERNRTTEQDSLRANYNYTSYDEYCRLYNSIYELT